MKIYPYSKLVASGTQVGLPKNKVGNSEVGHSNIGAGRIVYQPLQIIDNSIKNKSFNKNETIINAITHSINNDSKLHVFGLLSDGGVHSDITHLYKILDLCKSKGAKKVYLHLFLDGRDTPRNYGIKYIEQLEKYLKKIKIAKIATISGRFYAMDRDNRWERVEKAYNSIVNGKNKVNDYKKYIKDNYSNGIYDEFIEPITVETEGIVGDNDGIIVFNYRPDRLRELFMAITNIGFDKFESKNILNLETVTMFPVSNEVICKNAFKRDKLENTFGEYIAKNNLKQLRIAETEKYAHVTYFFDGGKDLVSDLKSEILIPSPNVETYDLTPKMSAIEITNKLIEELHNYDVVIVNYANGDMVGHTGDLNASILAVECLDECVNKLYNKVKEEKGIMFITADHGNCECMLDKNDKPLTSHTSNKVMFLITEQNYKLKDGKLGDIAPSILSVMNLDIPSEMTGNVIIKKL